MFSTAAFLVYALAWSAQVNNGVCEQTQHSHNVIKTNKLLSSKPEQPMHAKTLAHVFEHICTIL